MQQLQTNLQPDHRDQSSLVFLRMRSVMKITGLGRSTIYRLIASKQFPCPVRLTSHAVAWRSTDIEAWSETRPVAAH
ncbi:AlpA family transcriptional regulator [Hydrogenophaga aromaticivorans]|jgi:prophage regulatory protein|nr:MULTISPECIES: AlpA family transcriptional regulator [Hydrogenophaga]MBQ0919333.1 AlpA family transcriptional regulator [Hydrogenophaga aromaticivorans]UCU96557.1 AlpA family transcriptional regulator [Hydrogenophaga taeniospiralis]